MLLCRSKFFLYLIKLLKFPMVRILPLVIPTPSHIVHRVVGERICGFSSEEIDKLVDEETRADAAQELYRLYRRYWIQPASIHDLGRVSCSTLLADAENVVTKFGEKGLCYYILHHYLDRFEHILSGQLLNRYGLGVTAEDIPDAVKHLKELIKEGYELETSTINALILIFEKGIKTEQDLLTYEHNIIYRVYRSKETRRKKARELEELWQDCIFTIRPSNEQLAKSIVKIAIDLRKKIAENAEWILCTIYRYEASFPGLEKQLNNKINNALKQSLKCG
jgi:hypothetical protein